MLFTKPFKSKLAAKLEILKQKQMHKSYSLNIIFLFNSHSLFNFFIKLLEIIKLFKALGKISIKLHDNQIHHIFCIHIFFFFMS